MKKSIIILLALLFVALFAFSGCGKSGNETPVDDVAVVTIEEDEAKTIALEAAGITETAAENLVVESSEFEGVKAYVVSFDWSGFDYKYTIDASTGEILQEMFDGSVL